MENVPYELIDDEPLDDATMADIKSIAMTAKGVYKSPAVAVVAVEVKGVTYVSTPAGWRRGRMRDSDAVHGNS